MFVSTNEPAGSQEREVVDFSMGPVLAEEHLVHIIEAVDAQQ